MGSLNKVILMGNLTRDPESRFLPSGSALCAFTIAVNREWKKDGEKMKETTFVDVTAFGAQAEAISQYLKKGAPILIEGRLRQENWQDKATGQKRSKLTVVLESFSFVGGNNQEAAPRSTREGSASEQAPMAADDVPF